MGTLGVYRKEVLPWLVRWAHRAGKRDVCPALAACSSQPSYPVQNIIFLAAHFFTLLVSIPQQPGQAVVLGHKYLYLWC
jgi:hypothetical protein